MAKTIDIQLSGFAELTERLEALPAAVAAKALARAGRQAMKPVLLDSWRLAPKDTGVLAGSLRMASVNAKLSKGSVISCGVKVGKAKLQGEIEIGDGIEVPVKVEKHADAHWRWHFVEFGTSKVAARPFLRPALQQNIEQVFDILRAELRKNIERAWARQAQETV